METEIEKLANFIMNEVDGEPSKSESAVDCAIRIIKQDLSNKKEEKVMCTSCYIKFKNRTIYPTNN